MCNTYNGHANYPTWNVNLWIDNDQGLYNAIQEMTIETYNDAIPTQYSNKAETAIRSLEDQIKDLLSNEMNPLADDASLYSALLGWALSTANWYEIAENWIEQVIDDGLIEEEETELED